MRSGGCKGGCTRWCDLYDRLLLLLLLMMIMMMMLLLFFWIVAW